MSHNLYVVTFATYYLLIVFKSLRANFVFCEKSTSDSLIINSGSSTGLGISTSLQGHALVMLVAVRKGLPLRSVECPY
jgi:hypothetical protein